MRQLMEAGIDVNQQDDVGWTLLHHAAAARSLDVISILMEREEPFTVDDLGNQYIVEFPILVDLANYTGHTALMLACTKNDTEVIEKLILGGADPRRIHISTSASSYDMCASADARDAVERGLEQRAVIMEQRAKDEEERVKKEAFRESLRQKEKLELEEGEGEEEGEEEKKE
jgi:ankyrin repeat protein